MSARRADRALAAGAVGAIALVVATGTWLRLGLGGHVPLPGTFAFVRHAHSHVGVYAVLFPLLWIAWRAAGLPSPGLRTAVVYLAAAFASFLGFFTAGYGKVAIVGSTVVGVLWLVTAFGARGAVLRGPPLLRFGPIGIVVAAAIVPAIAVTTRRDPALAQAIVKSFLSVLMFSVLVPASLAKLGARASVPAALALFLGALGTAAFLGVAPGRATGLAAAAYGALVAYEALRAGGSRATRLAFAVAALGTLALGLRGTTIPHATAMAGLHFLVLGPLLGALAPPPGALRFVGLGAAAAMGASLAALDLGLPGDVGHGLAAAAGVVALVPAVAGFAALVRLPRGAG